MFGGTEFQQEVTFNVKGMKSVFLSLWSMSLKKKTNWAGDTNTGESLCNTTKRSNCRRFVFMWTYTWFPQHLSMTREVVVAFHFLVTQNTHSVTGPDNCTFVPNEVTLTDLMS